uniref:Retrotransposon gag domain-containing protein n=1 Tax=Fagus sylvatica TaxID=28930 RepID=A0A2N9H3T1_FAGSY
MQNSVQFLSTVKREKALIHAQRDVLKGRGHTDGGLNNNNHQYTPRTVKLDFPRFNGAEDPTSWICRAEQFFRFHETPIEDHGLLARYGPTQFFDHFGELTKLQQIGTVKDYHTKFEQLLAKAGPLPRVRQVSCFVSGLKEGIKADVLAGRPADLPTAIGLARLYEARNSSFRRTTAPVLPINKMPPFSPREDTKPRSSFPLKRLTPTELKERREKGLCYNCNERFVPSHRLCLAIHSCRFAHCFCRLQPPPAVQSSPAQLQAFATVSAASRVQPPPTGPKPTIGIIVNLIVIVIVI